MSDLAGEIRKGGRKEEAEEVKEEEDNEEDFEWCWVHVGDDLARPIPL